ncbi:hypothetical protein [Runella slithyformis]|uniref:Uncharacterized protein n=1 Tax=Runella slithyformis (strain ATCC 29530 / DSM 19594 / LMG 11500 / NCIMB 11436 / LSU 4) TaxID=761193 RepID=A0A7U3ZN06_RUNSL|nr:hypothetical protein [Runella slithyformis]AEI50215.1 hypothetical protein Runsl_3857 [Runella slithyformis DSM 19594]
MKSTLLLLTTVLSVCIGCNSDNIRSNCSPVRLVTNIDTLTSVDLFSIQNVNVNKNTLTLQFAYGGGCDPNHAFALYVQPSFTNGLFPERPLEGRVIFTTKDACKRLDTNEFCFDLTELKNKYPKGSIRIRGFCEAITY